MWCQGSVVLVQSTDKRKEEKRKPYLHICIIYSLTSKWNQRPVEAQQRSTQFELTTEPVQPLSSKKDLTLVLTWLHSKMSLKVLSHPFARSQEQVQLPQLKPNASFTGSQPSSIHILREKIIFKVAVGLQSATRCSYQKYLWSLESVVLQASFCGVLVHPRGCHTKVISSSKRVFGFPRPRMEFGLDELLSDWLLLLLLTPPYDAANPNNWPLWECDRRGRGRAGTGTWTRKGQTWSESLLQTDVLEEEEESPSFDHSLFSDTQHSECAVWVNAVSPLTVLTAVWIHEHLPADTW